MVRAVNIASTFLDKFCRAASVGFLSLMLLLVLLQVVARYIFQSAPVWTEEAARYCMVWGGLLGATISFKADRDPRLFHPPRSGPRIWIFSSFWIRVMAAVIFLGPVFYHSDRFLSRGLHRATEAMEIPMAWITVAVPLAVVVIFIHITARILHTKAGTE
ncbi:MAG: TRAP transporter small permease subunit [Desulfobacteraceae bacterium]|nr:MAG: TRAP transporter small permease subunit [Desulfobacteraceae bacterium]